jgi:hypothetical protein
MAPACLPTRTSPRAMDSDTTVQSPGNRWRTTLKIVIALAILLSPHSVEAQTDRRFDILVLETRRYTNAIVFSATSEHVMLSHEGGLTSLRVKDLDSATLEELGYRVMYKEASGNCTERTSWSNARPVTADPNRNRTLNRFVKPAVRRAAIAVGS